MCELVIFSLDDWLFGVDAGQIREIFRLQSPPVVTAVSHDHPFHILHHQHTTLPLFDLRRHVNLPDSLSEAPLPQVFEGITFYAGNRLFACRISSIENIIKLSFRSLQPVPYILKQFAEKIHIWGFYEYSGEIVPLLDLEHLIPENMLHRYTKYLQKLSHSSCFTQTS